MVKLEQEEINTSIWIGEDWTEEHLAPVFGNNEAVRWAIEWLVQRLKPGSELLDAGSGTGIPAARRLSEAGMLRLRPNCSISANGQASRLRLRWQ